VLAFQRGDPGSIPGRDYSLGTSLEGDDLVKPFHSILKATDDWIRIAYPDTVPDPGGQK
jgi:hypothetical protein